MTAERASERLFPESRGRWRGAHTVTARLARARVREELVPARGQRPQPGRPCRMPPHAPPPPRGLREGRPALQVRTQGTPKVAHFPVSRGGDRHATGPRASPRALPPAVTTGSALPPSGVPRVRRARPPAAERGQLQRGGSLDSPGACSVHGGTAVTGRPAVALEAEAEATLPKPQGQWEPGRGQGGGTGGEGATARLGRVGGAAALRVTVTVTVPAA